MKEYDHERRQFLKLAISLPIAFVIGCDLERKPEAKAPILNPEESLKKTNFCFVTLVCERQRKS